MAFQFVADYSESVFQSMQQGRMPWEFSGCVPLWGGNLKKGMSCTCTIQYSLVWKLRRERTTLEVSSDFFYWLLEDESFVWILFPPHKLANLLFWEMIKTFCPSIPEEIWRKGSFAVRLISAVPSVIVPLDVVQHTHYCVVDQLFCGSCQKESFFFLKSK